MISIKHFQKIIEEHLSSLSFEKEPLGLYTPIRYILDLGGKRIRPSLVLLSNSLFNNDITNAVHAATALEIFHNFTLIHDDIMDKAPVRRSMPTVHIKWNDNAAILSGDAMMILAYEQLLKLDANLLHDTLRVFNQTAIEVCEGQQMDMEFENSDLVSLPAYLEMIRLKTSVLIAATLQIGGITAGADIETQKRLYHMGEEIGLGFQIQDDYLDAYADRDLFGKTTGGDIVQNKKTFLLLSALKEANNELKEEIYYWLGKTDPKDAEEKVKAMTSIFTELGIDELARETSNRYFDKALLNLHELNGNAEATKVLEEFILQVKDRNK